MDFIDCYQLTLVFHPSLAFKSRASGAWVFSRGRFVPRWGAAWAGGRAVRAGENGRFNGNVTNVRGKAWKNPRKMEVYPNSSLKMVMYSGCTVDCIVDL